MNITRCHCIWQLQMVNQLTKAEAPVYDIDTPSSRKNSRYGVQLPASEGRRQASLDSDHGLRRPCVAITFTSFVALCAFKFSGLFPANACLCLCQTVACSTLPSTYGYPAFRNGRRDRTFRLMQST